MSVCALRLAALDTLMFRDGRPFNQGDEGASAAQSSFPPPPPTVIGAIRLALALQNGFDGTKESWPDAALGNGVDWQAAEDQLEPLKFGALRLARETAAGLEFLYPAPAHLASARKEQGVKDELIFLLPRLAFETDLGREVFLASAPDGYLDIKTQAGSFLTQAGMLAVLNGELPSETDVIAAEKLWSTESRVGIGINAKTRVVNDGQLYTASFTRPADELVLVQPVSGIADDVTFATCVQRLGGEHRAAEISGLNDLKALPGRTAALAQRNDRLVYAAIAIAPVFFDTMPIPGDEIEGLNGTLLSAGIGKPVMMGGWNSQAGLPLPMRQVLPAGSVFFMQADDEMQAQASKSATIGKAGAWGFGQVLTGKWDVA